MLYHHQVLRKLSEDKRLMVLLESKVIKKLHCNLVLDLYNSIVLFNFEVPFLILDWRDLNVRLEITEMEEELVTTKLYQ